MTKEMQKVKKDLEQARKNKVDLETWTSSVNSNNLNLLGQTVSPTPILGQQNNEVNKVVRFVISKVRK